MVSSVGFRRMGQTCLISFNVMVGLYALVAWPPLNIVFDKVPDPPTESVCFPGSGFSGFWYHMGFIDRLNLTEIGASPVVKDHTQFYCFSSGCLSLVLAGHDKEFLYDMASAVQDEWLIHRNVSQYNVVQRFLNTTVLGHHESRSHRNPYGEWIETLIPRLNIMISSWNNGVKLEKAESIEHLVDLLLQTTYIPLVTGPPRMLEIDGDSVLDGGFSRVLHPSCGTTISVPLLDKGHLLHSLNPGMSKDLVWDFWDDGRRAAETMVMDRRNNVVAKLD